MPSVRALLRARTSRRRERLIASEWQVAFDSISDAVVLVEEDGRVRRCNRAFARFVGLTSADEAIQENVRQLLPELDGWSIKRRDRDPEITTGGRVLRMHVDQLPDSAGSGHAVLTLRDVTAEAQLARERERVLRRERLISTTLQQALVLRHLPEVPGLELRAKYALAESDVLLGGDWFDVIPTEQGIWLAVGDVAGHGVAAAAQAVQLRHSLRLLAEDGYSPADAMTRLGELLASGELVETASVMIAALGLGAGTAELVCAGHPPPILLTPGSEPRVLEEVRGPLLGVGGEQHAVAVSIGPGETLVIYTDGVVERRREPIDVGIARLCETLTRTGSIEKAFDELLPEGPRDDATILGARWDAL